MKKFILLLFLNISLITFFVEPARAQIKIDGIADAELKKGGDASNIQTNGVPSDNPSFIFGRLHLFLSSTIAENVAFDALLTADRASGLNLSLKSASITFKVLKAGAFTLNVETGKIIRPFGAYPKTRWFSPENPFIYFPLMYSYSVNISKSQGFYPGKNKGLGTFSNNGDTQKAGGITDLGLPIISPNIYDIGIKTYGNIIGKIVEYDIAITNNPISSPEDFDINILPAFMGRIGFSPMAMLKTGISFNYGVYMDKGVFGSKDENKVINFNQITGGLDLNLNILFLELNLEGVYNLWTVPKINDEKLSTLFNSLAFKSKGITLSNQAIYADLKVNMPFLSDLYTAVKFELIRFDEIDPKKLMPKMSFPKGKFSWDDNITRIGFAVGYKITKGTLVKFDFQTNITDTKSNFNKSFSFNKSTGLTKALKDLNDDVIAFQLSTTFDILKPALGEEKVSKEEETSKKEEPAKKEETPKKKKTKKKKKK
jgi:hypothetical protein